MQGSAPAPPIFMCTHIFLEMESCPQEATPKNEILETLEDLARNLQQISESYFEMQGNMQN